MSWLLVWFCYPVNACMASSPFPTASLCEEQRRILPDWTQARCYALADPNAPKQSNPTKQPKAAL